MRPPESFVGQPIRSLQTMLRVIAQDDARYSTVIPDGIYGPETVAAISRFQSIHGIPVTGITDQNTWEAIVKRYEPAGVRQFQAQTLQILMDPGEVLRKGQKNANIALVQGILGVLSDTYGSIGKPELTGVLDEATSDALAAFQYLSGLEMTGELDKITWKHLALHYPIAAGRWQGA